MQVFEFHFNPRAKEGTVFDSFIYEPENIYEKKLGNLYIVGELSNALPKDARFLKNLSSALKESYYKISDRNSAESSLKNSLKEGNKFLEKEEKEGNVGWLGNLNIVAISLKDTDLTFTKAGNIKVLLARDDNIVNVGKELEKKTDELSSLKIFTNVVTGKLSPGDKIIILTNDAFDLFSNENLFPQITAVFNKYSKSKDIDKQLKNVLNKKRSLLSEIAGVFVLVFLDKNGEATTQMEKTESSKKKFSIKIPSLDILSKIKEKKPKLPNLGFLKNTSSLLSNHFLDKLKSKVLPKKEEKGIGEKIKGLIPKNLPHIKISGAKEVIILVFLFVLVLAGGNHILKAQKQKEFEEIQSILIEIQKKAEGAENALIFKDEKEANLLYQEAWKEIVSLAKKEIPKDLEEETESLKESIEKELFSLNKIEENPVLSLVFEFNPEIFIPQKMINSGSEFYFFNYNENKIYNSEEGQEQGKLIQIPEKVKLVSNIGSLICFLSESNKLITLKGEMFSIKDLEAPYPNFDFKTISSYGYSLYFLENEEGEIIKYRFEQEKDKLSAISWLDPETEKVKDAQLITIDGSVWVLKNNSLLKYHIGEYKKTITLDFFPQPQEISRIVTQPNFSNIYLLTPSQKRIVVLSKDGNIVKQFKSDELKDLKDFAVSEDEKTIYLLDELKLYKIEM